MNFDTKRQTEFFSEMSERQISAGEFFSNLLLDSLERNYGLNNGVDHRVHDTEDRHPVLDRQRWGTLRWRRPSIRGF